MTCAIPVFISACYGSGYSGEDSETLNGTVKNASGQGIPNISVTCISGVDNGDDQAYSQSDGSFSIPSYVDSPCVTLRFEDVDAAENGTYVSQDVTVGDSADAIDVVMQEPTV
jgi:hypothetical protein